MRWAFVYLFMLSLSLGGVPARAAVTEADAGHLVLNYSLPVKAAPDKAYAAAVDIAHWWSSDHTYSGDAKNLHRDAKAGGCWCEMLKDGGVEHMRVVLAMPGKLLRLSGGLGPLQSGALNGTLTFQFKASDEGSSIAVSYLISGYFKDGLDKVGSGVDQVLGAQLQRLQQLIDTGSAPEARPAK